MYTKTYIYFVFQNLDLYHIPKPRFIPYYKINISFGIHINLAFGMRYKSRFWYVV
jgi:hypothetical protein